MKKHFSYGLLAAGLFLTQPVVAETIRWTDWTYAAVGASGSATGTIQMTKLDNVTINYKGDVAFAELDSGINYWTEGVPAPYTGNSIVDNPPPAANMIASSRGGTINTIIFSRPVWNPIMAIVSLGAPWQDVSCKFSSTFKLLGEGCGYWDCGSSNVSENTLTGRELHGVIQFQGLISSISWTASTDEWWYGFTIGLPGTDKQINPDNGHAYQRFDTSLTWSDAKAACEGLGAHLATITSQAENDWVVYHMTADADLSVWIGGTDQAQDGVWEWVTGEPWNYTNWHPDEPNNFCGGESYVTLWGIETPRRWNDYGGPGCNSDVTSEYICEWENSDGRWILL